MVRAQLSQEVIEQLAFLPRGKSFQVWWDKTLPGFGVRIYPSGAKSFVCKYRKDGIQYVDTLGSITLLSLEQARDTARLMLIDACRSQKRAPGAKESLLVDDFCNEYIQRFAKEHRADWNKDKEICMTYLNTRWQNRLVSSINPSDVEVLVNGIAASDPLLAKRIREQIATMWDCAKFWKYVAEESHNPADGLRDLNEREAEYWLQDFYTERFWEALESEPNYFARAAILVLLFSGLHKDEVIQAKWAQIDWESKTISVERWGNKRKRLFVMPLSEPALMILEAIPKHPENPYVFCGRERGRPVADLDEPLERTKKLAGLSKMRIQDLRLELCKDLSRQGAHSKSVMRVLGYFVG